jgi:hypothetical protein
LCFFIYYGDDGMMMDYFDGWSPRLQQFVPEGGCQMEGFTLQKVMLMMRTKNRQHKKT